MITVTFASINDRVHHRGTVYTACTTLVGKERNIDVLSPTKELVYGHKSYTGDTRFRNYPPISNQEYTRQYAKLLKSRAVDIRKWIDSIEGDCTIVCFCPSGKFCHRVLLSKWFKSYRSDLNIQLF